MTVALVGGRILTDQGFASGLGVVVDGARVAAILPEAEALSRADDRYDLDGGRLAPASSTRR